jgi:hypothetical protein
LVTGAGRALYPIFQAEVETVAHLTVEDSDLTSEESAGSVANHLPKVMARFETSVTGSAEVHYLHCLNRNVDHETADAHEQMMDQRERVSGTEDLPQLHGARVDHKDRKMAARDPQEGSSRNDLLLSELLLLLSRTANGVQRCDLTHLRPSLQFHLVMAARLLHLQLSEQLRLQPDLS